MIERCVEEDECALETGNGPPQVVIVEGTAIGLLEHLLVGRIRTYGAQRAGLIRMAHLDRIEDRQLRLLFQRGGSAVPEHALKQGRVQSRGGTAPSKMV